MKKKIIVLLILFFVLSINVKASETIIYDEDIGSHTSEEISDKLTLENNSSILKYEMIRDGELNNKVDCVSFYRNPSIYPNYFEMTINDLNIDTSKYDDLRLDIGYFSSSVSSTLVNFYGLIVYTIDEEGQEYGPYYLDDYSPTGYFNYKDTEVFYRGYRLITQNLKNNSNIVIKSIKIIPYGNLPKVIDESKTYTGAYRVQGTSFVMDSLKISGYKGERYKKTYTTSKTVDIQDLKKNIALRMYDTATVRWIPDIDMHPQFSIGGNILRENVTYRAGETYYGLPYTQRNRVTIEKYIDELDDNKKINSLKDSSGNQSYDFYGQDCATAIYYSMGKFIPYESVVGVLGFLWDRSKTKLLGGLDLPGNEESSAYTYENLIEKYKTENNRSDFSESILKRSELESKSRIKSNISVIKYIKNINIDGKSYDYLAYLSSGLSNNEPLKLSLNNLNIDERNIVLKIIYHKYNSDSDINPTFKINGLETTANLRSDEEIHNYHSGQTVVSIREAVYELSVESIIDSIEIYPYGSNSFNGAFRLSNLNIESNNNILMNMSAVKYNLYYDLASKEDSNNVLNFNFNSNELDSEIYNGFSSEQQMIISKFLASQKIFNAYSELNVGDVVATNSTEGSIHIGLIMGSTYIKCLDGTVLSRSKEIFPKVNESCNEHGGIDSENSYYIKTDISSSPYKAGEDNKNSYGGLINNTDVVASKFWEPNKNFTDIEKLSDLNGKNLNFRINVKNSFFDGLKKAYLPITLNLYETGEVEEPMTLLFNGNTSLNIKDGLKGTIYSNYVIERINFSITNNKTSDTKEYHVYPSHAPNYPNVDNNVSSSANPKTYNKEGLFANYYSLYYNLPDDNSDINKQLKQIIDDSDGDYEVIISVDAGTGKNMEVLHLGKSKVNTPLTGIKKYSIVGFVIALFALLIIYKKIRKFG